MARTVGYTTRNISVVLLVFLRRASRAQGGGPSERHKFPGVGRDVSEVRWRTTEGTLPADMGIREYL